MSNLLIDFSSNTNGYIVFPIVSFLVFLARISIDYINVTDFEKKLITNFKRVSISFSQSLIMALFFTLPFISLTDGIEQLFSIFVYIFGISLFISIVISLIAYVVSIKYHYYVFIENSNISNQKWYVVRKVSKNRLLLRDTSYNHRFFEEEKSTVFYREKPQLNKFQEMLFYGNFAYKVLIVVTIFVTFSLLGLILYAQNEYLYGLLCFIFCMFIIAVFTLLMVNYRFYNKLDEKEKKIDYWSTLYR